MENVSVFNVGSYCIQDKDLLRKFTFRRKRLGTISRWNRCSTYVKSWYSDIQMKIYGVAPTNWENSSWTIILDWRWRRKVYVFSDSELRFGKMNQHPTTNSAWEEKFTWFKSSAQYRTLNTINGEPMEFEWNIFTGFTALECCNKVQEFMSQNERPIRGRIIFMSMFNDISWGSEDNEQECNANANLVSICARRFPRGLWSFLGLGSEKQLYSTRGGRPQGEWDNAAGLMMINSEKADIQFSVPRVHCPEERSKSKGGGKLSIHFCADGKTIETFSHIFSVISSVFTEPSQICVMNTESAKQDRWDVWWQNSLFEPASLLMKTPTPSTEDPAQEELLREYQERAEKQDRVIKIGLDEGFLTTVKVGQYFMTKGHCRVLTMYRTSGMSCVHFAKRWEII